MLYSRKNKHLAKYNPSLYVKCEDQTPISFLYQLVPLLQSILQVAIDENELSNPSQVGIIKMDPED